MLLREMYDLQVELEADGVLPPIGFDRKPVGCTVELDASGAFVSCTVVSDRSQVQVVPVLKRSGKNPPATICIDNAQYVLGVAGLANPAEQAKAANAHRLYLDRLDAAIDDLSVDHPAESALLVAVRTFLRDLPDAVAKIDASGYSLSADAKGQIGASTRLVRFRVDGVDPTETGAVRSWWATQLNTKLAGDTEVLCQVSGDRGVVARILPALNVKPGNQPTLISANLDAAERYGASQSSGAGISVSSALKSHQALNWLLANESHSRRVGDITFVWWVPAALDDDPVSLLMNPQPDPEVVGDLLKRAFAGGRSSGASIQFRLLSLSVNIARVVIRSDYTTNLPDIERSLARWFTLTELPGRDGPWYPSILRLADAALRPGSGSARTKQKDRVIESLMHAAVLGRPVARFILNDVVDRCRVGSIDRSGRRVHVTLERAALLRTITNLQEVKEMSEDSIGSLCGRMIAVLEDVQYAALGDINRSIVDSYYSSASTTPQRVMPKLLDGAQAHLRKLSRNQKRGIKVNVERRIAEISSAVKSAGGLPPALTIAEQADFALGYWQERQEQFERRANASSAKSTINEKEGDE